MTAPANRWKLGMFVIGGAAATLLGMTWIGINELKRDFHVAYAYFDEALTGLEEGSPVKFRGVAIGVVKRIRVAPDKKHLEVEAALYDDYLRDLGLKVDKLDGIAPLPDNLRAQVVISWVTSTAFIQVDFFPDPPSGPQQVPFEVPPDHNTLRTVPSTAKSLEDASREVLRELPLVAISARELMDLLRSEVTAARLPALSSQLQGLLQRLDALVAEVQQQGTVASATSALDSLRDAASSVRDTAASLRDEHGPIASSLAELRRAADAIRDEITAAKLSETAGDVRSAAAKVERFGGDASAELVYVRSAIASLERLASLLERDPGALLHGRSATRSPLQESGR